MLIIAETAFNHNGDKAYLKDLILASKNCGANYVTVQVMNPEKFCETQYAKYKIYTQNYFTKEEWLEIFEFSKSRNIELIPCPLDIDSLKLCLDSGFKLLKIHSTDMLNMRMLSLIASMEEVKIILETQCATNVDIRKCLSVIRNNVICIMHGFSDYPTEINELNLNAIDEIRKKYNYKVGFADHTLDVQNIPLMCLAKNLSYFEKHITLDRGNRNFDWQVSLTPEEFSQMTLTLKKYSSSLGKFSKHPGNKEMAYRNIIFKKYKNGKFMRSDTGDDMIGSDIAIIARLKSKRLPKKIMKQFYGNEMILSMYNKLARTNLPVAICTSELKEDNDIVTLANKNKMKIFRGDPDSVIDRMIDFCITNKAGSVFRVTGDNPFTDNYLISHMHELFMNNDLDYVRVNGAPFGMSAEIFSTKYLWSLYKRMKNPNESEYLTWFAINDEKAKKGTVNVLLDEKYSKINFSVDYQEDLDLCNDIIDKIKLANRCYYDVNILDLQDIIKKSFKKVDQNKKIKLPNNDQILLNDYLDILNDSNKYIKSKNIFLGDYDYIKAK